MAVQDLVGVSRVADQIEDPDSPFTDPIEEMSGLPEVSGPDVQQLGLVLHVRTGRMHVCNEEGRPKTKCGVLFDVACIMKAGPPNVTSCAPSVLTSLRLNCKVAKHWPCKLVC